MKDAGIEKNSPVTFSFFLHMLSLPMPQSPQLPLNIYYVSQTLPCWTISLCRFRLPFTSRMFP